MYTSDAIALLYDIPLLLCHGTNDYVIDLSNSEKLWDTVSQAAAKHKVNGKLEPLLLVTGAKHCALLEAGGDYFKRTLLNCVGKWCGMRVVNGKTM
jgi:alpha-beta hydrolase superfamily lysophospholipase